MSHDDLRHLLGAYAATAPDLDPGAGLGERLARRDRRRRAAVALTACVAAVVAGTGVAALTRDPGGSQLRVADDQPSGSPTAAQTADPGEPTRSPEPTPAGTASEPSASASTSPSPSPGATGGEDPHGDPVTAHGRGADGLRVTATLSRDSTPTATRVTLRVEATDDDGQPQVTNVGWGDGGSEPIAVSRAACAGPPTPALPTQRPASPGDLTTARGHSWRNPGTYRVTVGVMSDVECDDDAAVENATVTLTIRVTPGRVVSNGPAEPTALHASVDANDDTDGENELYDYVAEFSVEDDDGHVRSVTIDWGDGSPPVTVRERDACDDGDGHHFPDSALADSRTHTYDPGAYTVTLSWESAGCDGAHVQRGHARVDVVVESID